MKVVDQGAFCLPEEVLGAKPRRSIGLGAVFTAPSGQEGKGEGSGGEEACLAAVAWPPATCPYGPHL